MTRNKSLHTNNKLRCHCRLTEDNGMESDSAEIMLNAIIDKSGEALNKSIEGCRHEIIKHQTIFIACMTSFATNQSIYDFMIFQELMR